MTRAAERLVCALALVVAGAAGATVPELLSYQGVLTYEATGKVAPDGDYVLTFRVWDDLLAGSMKMEEANLPVRVRNGLYSVLLGGASSTPLSEVFAETPRYMQVVIESGPAGISGLAVPPRQLIASVPYALLAREADTVSTGGAPEVPVGALILWDQATGCSGAARACPCGYSEAVEFQGMMIRGADSTERFADVPDDPGVSSGAPGGSGKYGDVLTAVETPAHTHEVDDAGAHVHTFGANSLFGNDALTLATASTYKSRSVDGVVTGAPSGTYHTHTVDPTGGSGAHRHPSRTALFCRKD